MKLSYRLILATLATTLALSGVAQAADTLPTPLPSTKPVPSAQQSTRLNQIKTRGVAEIDRRLDALQKALNKVQTASKLSEADKKTLTDQLQAEIDGLTKLKTELAGRTGLTSARADIIKIFDEYRVYGLILPKARLVATADRFGQAGERLQSVADNLQKELDAAKDQGKDVTEAQKKLDEMKAKLESAKAKYDGISAKVLPLTPADYNASHKILAEHRDALKSAREDFSAALNLAKDVIDAIKALKSKD